MSATGRRTIVKTFKESPDFGGFCGWPKIRKVLRGISDENTLDLFVGYLATGARAMELPRLLPEQVRMDYRPDQVEIRNMYVSKWREYHTVIDDEGNPVLAPDGKKKKYATSIPGYRTFHINKNSPIFKHFENVMEKSRDGEPMYPYTYNQIYYRICSIEAPDFYKVGGYARKDWSRYKGPWWTHRIRAEIACAMIIDYGFNSYALKKWFGWRTDQMPSFYGDMTSEDVARMMRKPQMTVEITPEKLSDMTPEQRDFVIELLKGK